MAVAAAAILSGNGHENREYYISNSEAVAFSEMAEMLSEITGKRVPFVSPDLETYWETLSRADLDKLLGRKTTTVREFLGQLYGPQNEG